MEPQNPRIHKCGRSLKSDLLWESPRPQEEAQQTADDHSHDGHDEESILFTDVLHPQPHAVKLHRHHKGPILSNQQLAINKTRPQPANTVQILLIVAQR